MAQNLVELRYNAKSVRPDTVSAGEIARLVLAAEAAVLAVVEDEVLEPDTTTLHFVTLSSGSIQLQFSSSKPSTLKAFNTIATQVREANYDRLAPKAVANLKKLLKFGREHNSPLEFRVPAQSEEPLATLVPASQIKLTPRIRGETTIYGEVIRLGGQVPRVRLRLLNGTEISCQAPKSLVQELGTRLYHTVGLRGQAQWETDAYSVVAFEVQEIISYDDSLPDPMAELSRRFGHYFDDIEDVDSYVAELRGDDPSEA